jgi:hypothetical protein
LHSRDSRLSRSERLSADPSWKLTRPPLDFLSTLVLSDFLDLASLAALISIARPGADKRAACAAPIPTKIAITSAVLLAHRVRKGTVIYMLLKVDTAHHLLHGHGLSAQLGFGRLVTLGGGRVGEHAERGVHDDLHDAREQRMQHLARDT